MRKFEFAVYIFCLKDLLVLRKVVGGLAIILTTSSSLRLPTLWRLVCLNSGGLISHRMARIQLQCSLS